MKREESSLVLFSTHKSPVYLITSPASIHLLKLSRSGLNQVSLKCLLGHCKTGASMIGKKVEKTSVKGIRQIDFGCTYI